MSALNIAAHVGALVLFLLAMTALTGWLLARTRPNEGECDCTRCAEKRANGLAEWEREYVDRQWRGDAQ